MIFGMRPTSLNNTFESVEVSFLEKNLSKLTHDWACGSYKTGVYRKKSVYQIYNLGHNMEFSDSLYKIIINHK